MTIALLKKLNKAAISVLEWWLVVTSYACFSFLCYYCLFVIGSYYHKLYKSVLVDTLICVSFCWFLFNIIFNYVMAIIVTPGFALEKSPGFQKVTKHCKLCENPKPLRTRHCKICDKCVLQMDHHCPLMHTCIGHNNRRYHLNVLLYVEIIVIEMLVLNENICNSLKYQYLLSVQILLTTISMINGIYTAMCWYLAVDGRTLVQFMRREKIMTKSSINNNIRIIFGTDSLWKALQPSVRPLVHKGIHWPEIQGQVDPYSSSIDLTV